AGPVAAAPGPARDRDDGHPDQDGAPRRRRRAGRHGRERRMAGRRSRRHRLAHEQAGRPAALRRRAQESDGAGSARPPAAAPRVEPPAAGHDLAAGVARSRPGPAMAGSARVTAGTRLRLLALLAAVLLAHVLALQWLAEQLEQPALLRPLATPMFTRLLRPQAPAAVLSPP